MPWGRAGARRLLHGPSRERAQALAATREGAEGWEARGAEACVRAAIKVTRAGECAALPKTHRAKGTQAVPRS